MTVGGQRVGPLAGWQFTAEDHAAWTTEPAYRFLDDALRVPDQERTHLQRRALISAQLLSQAWLARQPEVMLLNAVMALEVLLGEDRDNAKKFRIARRAAYFACGWPDRQYVDGGRPACPYLALPLHRNGELATRITAVRSRTAFRDCTQFFDMLDLYDARNDIVHGGKIEPSAYHGDLDTWFIGAILLQPVLEWFAANPGAELDQLHAEIAAMPAA
jgi:hypothetical protein